MKRFNYLVIIIFVILSGCESTSLPECEDEDTVYIVKKIMDMTIEEFKEDVGLACDYPIEIQVTRLDSNQYVGTVLFEISGLKAIQNCIRENCFLLEVKYEIERVETIVFYDLIITDAALTGNYVCTGQLYDGFAFDFLAEKKL